MMSTVISGTVDSMTRTVIAVVAGTVDSMTRMVIAVVAGTADSLARTVISVVAGTVDTLARTVITVVTGTTIVSGTYRRPASARRLLFNILNCLDRSVLVETFISLKSRIAVTTTYSRTLIARVTRRLARLFSTRSVTAVIGALMALSLRTWGSQSHSNNKEHDYYQNLFHNSAGLVLVL